VHHSDGTTKELWLGQVAGTVGGVAGHVEGTWAGQVWGVWQRSSEGGSGVATTLTAPMYTFSAAPDDGTEPTTVQVRTRESDEQGWRARLERRR
jgi:hypothetical protein